MYLFHKNDYVLYEDLKYYNKLQQIIKDINNNNNNNLLDIPLNINNNIINIDEKVQNKKELIDTLLKELDNFLTDTFKKIDTNNELNEFISALQTLRENIIGRRIRIAFIGNINVGKSTILNCIIGENILPTNSKECTYRGIIIRHIEGEKFKLYKTKLVTKGKGSDEYYCFEDDEKPIREGIKDIKSYINIKNNDKVMEDKDAYLVLMGNLKIFDFIKLDKDIKSKIEFIDLPGIDRESNYFNKRGYYKKILRFSNCCIYINEPQTVDDEGSLTSMVNQYIKDKGKIFPPLRDNFIKSCIFLINKSDMLDNNEERKKIKDSILSNIKSAEEQFKDEIKEELKEELKEEIKEELKKEQKIELKEEIKEEQKIELKEELKEEIKEELKEEIKEEQKIEIKEEIKEELKKEQKVELKEEIKEELKEEQKDEINELPKKIPKNEIKKELKEENINISFFSGTKFFNYLNIKKNYIDLLNKEPKILFENLYKEYHQNIIFLYKNFKTFIFEKIHSLESNLIFNQLEENKEEEEEEVKIPENFIKNIKLAFEKLEKNSYKLFHNDEYNEVIKGLYNFKLKFEKIDILKENDYFTFFNNIKKSIENSEQLYNENIKIGLREFFSLSDIIFRKEIKKDTDEKINVKKKDLEDLISFKIRDIQKKFEESKRNIIQIFKEDSSNISEIINLEIRNKSKILKEAKGDLKIAAERFKNKIIIIYKELQKNVKTELIKLIQEIEKEEKMNNEFKNKNIHLSSSDINTKIGLGRAMFTSLITSTVITIVGEITLAETILGATASGIVGGPIGIGIGFAVGIIISLTSLVIHSLRKQHNYEKGLLEFRQKIDDELYEYKNSILEIINLLEEDYTKKFNLRLIAIQKDIVNIDNEEWKEVKEKYFKQKYKIYQLLLPYLKLV